jgi:hypothetical protein
MAGEQDYLKAILATVARQAFPPAQLAEMVTSNVGGEKQIAAYNLCDGDHSQSQIASAAGLDKGSLSRSISRWTELGIVIRIGGGAEQKPVHVYRLPSEYSGKKRIKKNGK